MPDRGTRRWLVAALGRPVVALMAATSPAGAVVSDIPSNPAAMTDLERATARIAAEEFEVARGLLEPIVRQEPGNAEAWSLLGFARRRTGDQPGALDAYHRALALEPLHRGANEYLGELWVERGELDRADERLRVLERACPTGCEERDELGAALAAARGAARP